MSEQGTAIARLSATLDVECPYCENEFDIIHEEANNGDYIAVKVVFSSDWDDIKGHTVYCPKCQKEFTLDGLEW